MFIGYDLMPALFVPVCLSPKTVAKLAKKMGTYYDNFGSGISKLNGLIDLDESVVVFFAKDKDELKRGLVSGQNVSYTASGAVVLYSGAYSTAKTSQSSLKSFGKTLGQNIKAVASAHGDVVSLKGLSHGLNVDKMRHRGHFVTVVSQKAINDANLMVPDTGTAYMGKRSFTNKDVASMLNHNQAVAPNTRKNDLESKINWFGMKQRAARRLNKAGMVQSIQSFQNQQSQPDLEDFDEFDD
jgi:hypothetical protein